MESATFTIRVSSSYFSKLPNPKSSPLRTYGQLQNMIWFRGSLRHKVKCVHNSNPISSSSSSSWSPLKSNLNSQNPSSSVSFSAVTEASLGTSELAICKLQRLISEFQSLSEPIDRVKRFLHYATFLPRFDESRRVLTNRVIGCTAQVWLDASFDDYGRMRFSADSDSEITKGFCSCLVWILDGAFPEEVLGLKTEDLAALNVGLPGRAHSRVNTWHTVLISMHKRTKALVAEREGNPPLDPFPSLVITPNSIRAKGSNAEAQVKLLFPDELKIMNLSMCRRRRKLVWLQILHKPRDPRCFNCCKKAVASYPYI